MTDVTTQRVHFRTCTLCEAMCGLRIETRDEEVRDIRGDPDDPFSRGHVCPKAAALADLHTDPDRLRAPVRRTAGGWEAVPWEAALDEVADRLHATQTAHGLDAVAVYLGNPNVHNLGAMVFAPLILRGLRTKNRFSATSVDQLPHMLASYLMFGHQLLLPVPDIDRTDYALVLGANPIVSNGSLMSAPGIRDRLSRVRARGGRIVVVDPRCSETARVADRHLFIRPGTDALFLLSLLEVVFERGARLGRLAPLCERLAELRAAAAAFPPERTAPHTGIAPDALRTVAAELLATRAALVYGRVGACTQEFGGLTAWLIDALDLVTGHLDEPGCMMFAKPAVDPLVELGGLGVGRGSYRRWHSRVRGLPEFGGELPVAALAEEVLTPGDGRVRALITMAGNPVLSTPNGRQLDRALRSLDFMVSVDCYVNETTRHAHLILPPVSPLERPHYDLALHLLAVRNTAKWSPPLFDPPAGSKDDWQIAIALHRRLMARRYGRRSAEALKASLLERLGPERVVDLGLRLGPYGRGCGALPSRRRRGLSLRALRDAPHGVDLGPLVRALPGRLPKRPPLGPGKPRRYIDLAPQPMLDDLRRLAARYPDGQRAEPTTVLIGRRQLRSNNSWMHNSARLMRGADRCTLLVHPDDAAPLGLNDADAVEIRSRVGAVVAPVQITRDIMPGVVSLPHGFGHERDGARLRVARAHAGVSVNDLTDDAMVDALSGNAALSGVPVEVRRRS
ncbi:MAG: molybdopterin-dependent oxidoreductase [Myxococcales bacterium]|nr:molybdopterin-dependent oxidoreductase [Myxococcales bacterium]